MNNASTRFRSPLMHQMIRNAQNQQRVGHSHQLTNTGSSSNRSDSSFVLAMAGMSQTDHRLKNNSVSDACTMRLLSSLKISPDKVDKNHSHNSREINKLPQKINETQRTILTRRTISRFEVVHDQIHPRRIINEAIERAVQCAMSAPNHKRTEPFTFKQMFSQTSSSNELVEIAYHVALCHKGEDIAKSKREKWSMVPAFLIAIVNGQPKQLFDCCAITEDKIYLPLDPMMPASERQLEDYASTCAAIQNIMLSLHSEGFGSKWATGPVIRTQAFRRLAGLKNDEVVVGLLMIGLPQHRPKSPKKRRQLHGDVLQEI